MKTLICVVFGVTVYRKCEAGSHGVSLWRIVLTVKTFTFVELSIHYFSLLT